MSVSVVLVFQTELLNRYEEGSQLAGVIYLHRISDGQSTVTTGRNFRMFRELCGDTALMSVVLITNMWDKGAHMARHHDTIQSTHDVIRRILVKNPVAAQIQWELADEPKYRIVDATAGRAIDRELDEQTRQRRAEPKGFREEVQASRDKGGEKKLDEKRRRLQDWVGKFGKDPEGVAANYTAERERMEARAIEVEWEARGERQRVDVQLASLDCRLQDVTDLSAAGRVRSEQEMKKPRDRVTATITTSSTPYVRVLLYVAACDG